VLESFIDRFDWLERGVADGGFVCFEPVTPKTERFLICNTSITDGGLRLCGVCGTGTSVVFTLCRIPKFTRFGEIRLLFERSQIEIAYALVIAMLLL
jgi:hypothetical protein